MVGLVLGLVLFAACGSSATPRPSAAPGGSAPAGSSVTVTLGIYSGRADPDWTLTADQAGTLEAMLAALRQETMTPPVGGLGYHGFTVQRPGGTLIAYLGSIAPPGEERRAVMTDPTRSIERYLLQTGRPHLVAAEIGEVERALAGS